MITDKKTDILLLGISKPPWSIYYIIHDLPWFASGILFIYLYIMILWEKVAL